MCPALGRTSLVGSQAVRRPELCSHCNSASPPRRGNWRRDGNVSQLGGCGLTRRCSGPAVPAGLHCSPGSSPSSVWPAAERFFVRPHQPGGWPLALTPLVGLRSATGPRRPRRSSRRGRHRGFQPAGSLVQLAAPPSRRVRPNQAMQRTGGVRGFTVLSPDLGRRRGRPAADRFFVRPRLEQSALPNASAVAHIRGPSWVSAHRPQGPRRGRPLWGGRVSSAGRRRRSIRCGRSRGLGSSAIPPAPLAALRVAA